MPEYAAAIVERGLLAESQRKYLVWVDENACTS